MVNLWPNSTFETSTDPWTANAGSDNPTVSSEHAYDGTSSMYCRRGAGTSSLYAAARAETFLPRAGDYDLTVRIWVPSTASGINAFRITGTGVTTQTLNTDIRDDWAELETTLTWDGTGTVVFQAQGTAQSAELWMDQLVVDDGNEPLPGSGIGCTVYTRPDPTSDLVRLADGSPTDNPLAPTVLSDLKVSWGRETTVDQPAASTCSFTLLDLEGGTSSTDFLALGTPVVVRATPPAGTALPTTEVPVFSGRVTSVKHTWDDSAGAPVVAVDTIDITADLEGTIIGDEPWPAESLEDRFARIAGATPLTDWSIDRTLSGSITYRDVDAQGAMGLLRELAFSVDGVLWTAMAADGVNTSLHLEDPAQRPATGAVNLTACDVLRDGVEWVQDVQDVISRVSTTWYEQNPLGSEEKTTEKTHTRSNGSRETRFGRRSLSVAGQLTTVAAADEVAQRILVRTGPNNWRITGLAIDDALYDPESRTTGAILTNYVPDPSGEYDGIIWSGATPYRRDNDSRTARTGHTCYDFTSSTANTSIAVEVPEWATSVTVSAWYRTNTGSSPFTYQLRVSGTGVTTTTSPVYTADSGIYQLRSLTVPVTGGGTINFYPAYNPKPSTETVQLRVDDFGIAFDTEPADFNGDTGITDDYVYAWTGLPGASPSIRMDRGSSEEYESLILTLLNSNTRNGLAIQLSDMPTWAIVRNAVIDLEGGSYTFTAGAWVLDLNVSRPT